MNPGILNKRVKIQQQSAGRDEYGQQMVAEWVDVANVYAAIDDLSGREFIAAAATQSQVQSKITIRLRSDVTAAMRVLHNSDIYNIEAVLRRPDRLLLMCSKGVNDG